MNGYKGEKADTLAKCEVCRIGFKELTIDDYNKLKPYFNNSQYKLSNYKLNSLIVWSNDSYTPYYKEYIDYLLIIGYFLDNRIPKQLLLPISKTKQFTPNELYDIAKQIDCSYYWFVPEDYIKEHVGIESKFEIIEDEYYHDYIYKTKELIELKGKKYSSKRNFIKQFEKQNFKTIFETITSQNIEDVKQFLIKWFNKHSNDDESIIWEKNALELTLNNLELFELKTIVLKIDGIIEAFAIGTYITNNMAVLQYKKANSTIKGLYQYFDKECIKIMFSEYEYINFESDMGISNLKKAKMSYYPCKILKSFKLKSLI